jgi:hypothetical protein
MAQRHCLTGRDGGLGTLFTGIIGGRTRADHTIMGEVVNSSARYVTSTDTCVLVANTALPSPRAKGARPHTERDRKTRRGWQNPHSSAVGVGHRLMIADICRNQIMCDKETRDACYKEVLCDEQSIEYATQQRPAPTHALTLYKHIHPFTLGTHIQICLGAR